MKRRTSLPKIAVVGTGAVGMAFAYGVVHQGLARELVLTDLDKRRAEGEAMDLSHSTAYLDPLIIRSGGYEVCRDADVFVVTAGKAQEPGQSRLDLLHANARIVISIMKEIEAVSENPIVIVVTNPLDVMTAVAVGASRFTQGHVFGSGTVLDTARFRHLLADHCRVDARSVHAHVIGEHGDSEVCVWSRANISNVPLEDFCRQRGTPLTREVRERIGRDVRSAAYDIIDRKGATAYGIGAGLCRILEGIVRDAKTLLTVSAPPCGVHGLKEDICLSLPCVIGAGGVEKVLETVMSDGELESLRRSAQVIHTALSELSLEKSLCPPADAGKSTAS
ncbi:MAG: L-lactate dehydrogenase [Desulfovibrionales bacterium]